MSELITVPTFTFHQGDPFLNDGTAEREIRVEYYQDDAISIRQDDPSDNTYQEIIIKEAYLKKLFKAIEKNFPEARKALKK
jgi:hypothetical protein